MAIQTVALQGLLNSPLTNAADQYQSGVQTRLAQAQEGRLSEAADVDRRQRTATVLGRALSFVEQAPPEARDAALQRYKTLALSLEPKSADTINAVGLADLPALKAATTQELDQLEQFKLEQARILAPLEREQAQLGIQQARQGLAGGAIDLEGGRLRNEGLAMDLGTKREQAAYYAGGGAMGPGTTNRGAAPVADGGSIVAAMFPNARITSTRRSADDPLTKAKPGSWHAKSGAAVDVAPIPGVTFEEYVGRLKGGGYEIIEAINETGKGRSPHATGDHWHVVLGEGGGGAPGAAGAGGAAGGASIVDRAASDPRIMNLLPRLAAAERAGDAAGARRVQSLIDARMTEISPKDAPSGYRWAADGNLQPIAGGPADPALKENKNRNVRLSQSTIDKLAKAGEGVSVLESVLGSFRPEYAGYGVGGDWANWEARNIGTGIMGQSDAGAKWWQEYQARKNVVRNQLFGAALTATEAAEFEKADISPNMRPDIIQANLQRQREIVKRAAQKLARPWLAQGADPEAVEAAVGIGLGELGVDVDAAAQRYDAKKFERGSGEGGAVDIDALLSKYGAQ